MPIITDLLTWLAALPAPVATALIAFIPSVELSVALPVGVLQFGLPVWLAYASAVAGSFSAVIAVFVFADPISKLLSRHSTVARKTLAWIFAHTREKFTPKYQRYGEVALLFFTAIPLPIPFSGAWSGALAAWLIGIPPRRAMPLLGLGTMIAGMIMAILTITGSAFLAYFLPKGL